MKRFLQKLFGADPAPEKAAVVVVSGLPRSGTSMMMKMLEAGGLPMVVDNIRTADEDNPRGYYELERVKQMDKGDTAWVAGARGQVVKVISALLEHLPPDESYRVLFMLRNMDEILASQRKMLEHRGEATDKLPDAEMAQLFAKHLDKVRTWLDAQPNFTVLYVDYNRMLADPQSFAGDINRFLGGGLDEDAMLAAVDPALYRNRAR